MLFDVFTELTDIYKSAPKSLQSAILEMTILYFGNEKYREKAKSLLYLFIKMELNTENDVLWGKLFREDLLDIRNDADIIRKIISSKINRRIVIDFSEYISRKGDLKQFSDLIIDTRQLKVYM